MSLPFKVHELLKDHGEDLAALEAFARAPGRTVDECHEWLEARGYVLSRSAVGTWKSAFTAQCMRERFSRSAELASAVTAAASADFDGVATAAKMQLTNVLLEQVSQLDQDGRIDPLDIQRMTRSLGNLVGTEERQRKMLAERFDREAAAQMAEAAAAAKAAGKESTGTITAEQLAEVRRRVFGV